MEGKLEKTYSEIMDDISYTVNANLRYYDFANNRCYDLRQYGYYYTEFLDNLPKYLYKDQSVIDLLLQLKKEGKIVFLSTNSLSDYAIPMLEYLLGEVISVYYIYIYI